jgi:hypothetical protein
VRAAETHQSTVRKIRRCEETRTDVERGRLDLPESLWAALEFQSKIFRHEITVVRLSSARLILYRHANLPGFNTPFLCSGHRINGVLHVLYR